MLLKESNNLKRLGAQPKRMCMVVLNGICIRESKGLEGRTLNVTMYYVIMWECSGARHYFDYLICNSIKICVNIINMYIKFHKFINS